jgi:predicted amidohydrolase YtcJ
MNRRDIFKVLMASAAGAPALATHAPAAGQAPSSSAQAFAPGTGDLAIVNAQILTMDERAPRAQAALVRGGRIVAAGRNDEVRALARGTPVYDARGRTVVPGFIDSHIHLDWVAAFFAYQADTHMPPVANLADIMDALRRNAARTAPGRWVIGRSDYGLDARMPEKRLPTRQELDGMSERHPVLLFSGLHVTSMNTMAAKAMGLWTEADHKRQTLRDGRPYAGGVVERDADGLPTGPAYEIIPHMPANLYSMEEYKQAIKNHAPRLFVQKGITSVSTMGLLSNDHFDAVQQLQRAGELPLRVRGYWMSPFSIGVDDALSAGVSMDFGNDMFRFGGFKLIPSVNAVSGSGSTFNYTQDELVELISKVERAGYQALLHTGGGESFDRVTAAVAEAQRRHPGSGLRHRLEHFGAIDPDRVRRLRELNMTVSITSPQLKSRPGAQVRAGVYEMAIRNGLKPVAITDATGTVPTFSPLFGIAALVAPASVGGSLADGSRLDYETALRMWTSWAAFSSHQERDKGSISPGKLGDFAVLSHDPLATAPDKLFDIQVDATIVGGSVVHEA